MKLKFIKSKKGASLTTVVIMLSLVFVIVVNGVVDISGAYNVKKKMTMAANAATRSATDKYDENQVPYGNFFIDATAAETSYIDILSSNLGVTLTKVGNYYEYVNPVNGNKTQCFIYIYNNDHKGTYVAIPAAGIVPTQVTNEYVQVNVDRPTIYTVITQEFKLSPTLGNNRIKLKKITAAQLNEIPPDKQKSATYN